MKKFLTLFLLSSCAICAPFEYGYTATGIKYVKHAHNEASYQKIWCKLHNGVEEFENKDYTRVDCLTDKNAVEFDFANKWAESIGQALHYELMTGKKAKVVLILDNPEVQMVYFNRVKKLAQKYNFEVEYVTNEILNLDETEKCGNIQCKCHKK